ncbi:hypothetical protein BC629DRAFT_494323 [Irpex lacteus]|nr:hypothetical protein BC629DRAFT_494323 [Irpex lacteus]
MKITEPVVVRKMRYDEIPEALRVYEEAFEGDPLEHYMKDTPDAHPGRYEELERLDNSLRFPQAVRKGQLLAIGEHDVDAFVTVHLPRGGRQYRWYHQGGDAGLRGYSSHMLSPQQKERAATFKKSFRQLERQSVTE